MKNLIIVLSAFLWSCTSDKDFETGKRQLEQQGYKDIKNTGFKNFCCSQDENFSTGFSCKDAKGNTVEGCFCSTGLKGVTIRFE